MKKESFQFLFYILALIACILAVFAAETPWQSSIAFALELGIITLTLKD